MLKPINNIAFKGIYTPMFTKFSDTQQKVYHDIKAKLGKEIENNDFFVKPSKNDSVELSKIYGLEQTGYGLVKQYTYRRKSCIGRYDEKKPFEMKDYKDLRKQQAIDYWGALALGVLSVGMMLGGLFVSANKKQVETQQVEKVATLVKDSLQNVKQDSLNFAKESLKVLK